MARKARGLEARREKTGSKYQKPSPMSMPETRKNPKGQEIILS